VLLACTALAPEVRADIVFGPWTFDDLAFADDVEQLEPGGIELYCDATDLRDALLGFSPEKQIVNVGIGGLANDFALYFTDLRATNEPGPDLVFFESAFSYEGFEIAVRPVGGSFTPLLAYPDTAFIGSGEFRCDPTAEVLGLPIDLDDFGLPAGTMVDGLRFRSLETFPGQIEGDPVMAAVLGHGCPPLPDRDGDGVGDACDCMPDGSQGSVGEPQNLRVLADRQTFTFVPDPADPGVAWRLWRGDLVPLRASGLYQMATILESTTPGLLFDATPPGAGRPLYYLVTAVLCEGGESTLGFDSLGRERRLSP
jgi:hypothetical protein